MADHTLPLFGISEFTTQPWSFSKDVESYSRLGIRAIEICEAKLDHGQESDQISQALDAGLTITSVQPAVRTLFPSQSMPEPKDLEERMECFKQSIRSIAPKTPGAPFVSNTGPPPKGDMQHVIDTSVQEYKILSKYAAEYGVKVALEPLNPTIVNIETTIWTLKQAMEIVNAVGEENFGICLDYWNLWQNADIENDIRSCGSKIFIVQASDWRKPQSFQDRLIPGQGEIPLAALLRATAESGYTGPYVVEIFSGDVPDSLWKGDLEKVIIESRTGFEAAWQSAFQK